jgi:plastocyanin
MNALSPRIAALLALAWTGIGCGGGGQEPPPPPPAPELTTVEVMPKTAALFTLEPGNNVRLTVVAKDQNGEVMAEVGSPSFSSDNEAVATVDADGLVTAIGAGPARITASLTAGSVTKAGVADVTVQVAPPTALVTAPQFAYQPETVDVSAGGTVTWSIDAIHHTVTFSGTGAPADIPELLNESADRTFPTSGQFAYRCAIHPAMTGTVRVH